MKKRVLLTLAAILTTACQWNALAPGDSCWYQRTVPVFRTDTIWNQVPQASLPDSVPYVRFVLFQVQTGWADSVRVCR